MSLSKVIVCVTLQVESAQSRSSGATFARSLGRNILAYSCVAFVFGLTACTRYFEASVDAAVLDVKGGVEIREGRSGISVPLTAVTRPRSGDAIRTATDARLRLALLPNDLIQLREDSELLINKLKIAKDGNDTDRDLALRASEVTLNIGRFYAIHEQRDAAETQFEVSTPHGKLIATSSCLFRIDVDEGRTRVSCARGSIQFLPLEGSAAILSAGYIGRWPSETDENITPAADLRGKDDLDSAKRIENDLLVARRRIRNALPL